MNRDSSTTCNRKRSLWFHRHRVIILLFVNAFLLFGVAVLFETGLRVFAPQWLELRMKFLAKGSHPDDFGTDRAWNRVKENSRFVSFVPNATFDIVHCEYQTTASIDEYGGRCLKQRPSASNGCIPCLGDSLTFGIGVNDGDTFLDHIQNGCDVRLLNLGVPGSAFPQQRHIVERRHSDLGGPPIYLQFFFLGNDFADILKNAKSLQQSQSVFPKRKRRRSSWEELSFRLNESVNNCWLRHSYALQFSRRIVIHATGDKRKNPVFDVMNVDSRRYQEDVRTVLRSEIEKWQTLASEKGFRMVVIFVPDCYQLDSERRKLQAKYYGIDHAKLDPLLPNRMLSECLREKGIVFIDATDKLIGASDASQLYYVNDHHFTAKGHRRFAEAISADVNLAINSYKTALPFSPRIGEKIDARTSSSRK